jgi:Holliday junction resolvase
MEISKQLIYKNLYFLAIEQIAEEYKSKGYLIEKEKQIGKFHADILATKGEEKIVFEVKAGIMTPERKEELAKLADYVNSLGNYKFKVVIAREPKEKNIEIASFETLLFEYLINEMPSALDELSTHTTVEFVYDIEIHNLLIHNNNEINVIGQGTVEVQLQYGSDMDQHRGDGHIQSESFPFDFDLYLNYDDNQNLRIKDGSVNVNTDSFYE